ncbi:MAG TPA: hypothetical protein VLB44_22120 [Kofleriaceae bacterium]|nr:hypothetical protein [Kofleriaceae bacterium]
MVARWVVVLCMLGACGDNIQPWTATPCHVTGEFSEVGLQDFASDGNLAFIGDNNLYVASPGCDGQTVLVAPNIAHAWFCGPALLAFPNPYTPDTSPALIAWNRAYGPMTVAMNVDPTATHCSPDGRHFSTEANDVLDDGTPTVNLMVFDTSTLVAHWTYQLDRPRARFTHDSTSVLIASAPYTGAPYSLSRLTLADGRLNLIGPIEHSRFEISKDDQYVVFTRLPSLVRMSLASGTEQVLADDLTSVPGRDELVADDDLVAYIGGGTLRIVPLTGGPPKTLATASTLVAHLPGLIFYVGPDGFSAVTTAGAKRVFKNGLIEDSTSERVLIAGGSQRFVIDLPSFAAHSLAGNYPQAALTRDDRIVALEPDTSIKFVTGYHDVVLPATRGAPFILDRDRRELAAVEYATTGTTVRVVRVQLP